MRPLESCKVIYPPKGQAGEYAKYATNPYRGCGHACAYCYVPLVTKQARGEFDAGAVERREYLAQLEKDAAVYQAHGIRDNILLSFTTDPYNPDDVELQTTRHALEILKAHNLVFTTLTKGGRRALRDIELFTPGVDQFASTLTSLDPDVSLKWERRAALPADRIETLQTFKARGISTWVSLEPVFDTVATIEIIRRTHSFVDLYKVGRINYSELTKRTDWDAFTQEVLSVLNEVGARHYIKKDLQQYVREVTPLCVNEFTLTAPTKSQEVV